MKSKRKRGRQRSKVVPPPQRGRTKIALQVVDLGIRATLALAQLLRVLLDV